ncbi:MAG: ATP-binding cassette domain-containing protein, partial [Muriicola sp.]|nr:ATP-binding cassette domain-containing protein [Muriicola sp.]NNK35632.1 ATP-binding cassette domain-containing protein [Eudoraea sp.]
MEEPVLSLKEVAVFQKENLVLNDINLEVRKGEFVYLIGKTGSGKSSFMKTLYADLPLKQGHGRVVGFNLKTLE